MNKYPCDFGNCPYEASGGYDCYNYCGLGADTTNKEEEEKKPLSTNYTALQTEINRLYMLIGGRYLGDDSGIPLKDWDACMILLRQQCLKAFYSSDDIEYQETIKDDILYEINLSVFSEEIKVGESLKGLNTDLILCKLDIPSSAEYPFTYACERIAIYMGEPDLQIINENSSRDEFEIYPTSNNYCLILFDKAEDGSLNNCIAMRYDEQEAFYPMEV